MIFKIFLGSFVLYALEAAVGWWIAFVVVMILQFLINLVSASQKGYI